MFCGIPLLGYSSLEACFSKGGGNVRVLVLSFVSSLRNAVLYH